MEWISVKDRLPPLSYVESDNPDDPYVSFPVLVFSLESSGTICVAYLVMNQDENDIWNFEELSWELYIPGNGGEILERNLEEFTHWMPLPNPPEE